MLFFWLQVTWSFREKCCRLVTGCHNLRERVRDLLGESPVPQTQLSLRADTSFLPGATSEGSNSPSDSNRIKLTIFVISVDSACCFLKLPWTAHIQTTISDPTWAVSMGPRWLSCCSICWQFLVEVSPWLGLTILLKAQPDGLEGDWAGRLVLLMHGGVTLFWNKFLWNEGMQDNPFCNHQLSFEKQWRNSTQEATLEMKPTASHSFGVSPAFP